MYTKDPQVAFNADVNDITAKTLNSTQKVLLSSSLTKSELVIALKETKHAKTLGPDGLPADYYMVFCNKVGDLLYEAFMDSVAKRRLFCSAHSGVIALIPKKN